MKSYKEEYLKVLDVLIEVQQILEENGFNKGIYNSDLSDLYALTKKLLSIAYKYKKWNIDKNVMAYKGFKEIEYGIGIFRFKNITNYGDIDEEELLKISFPTGGYIFGDYYDVEYFEEFYKELHNVKPKYEDVLNHALYYSVDNGDEAYAHYKNTYDKFFKNYATRRKQMQIKELEEQISKLKEE